VPELREKIKQFLASQGMIKGHSGSGARNMGDGPAPILILSEGVQPNLGPAGLHRTASNVSSPSSPQSPPSALSNNSHHSYPHVVTSALRDMRDGPSHSSHHRGSGSSDVYSPLSPDTDSPYPPHHSSSSGTLNPRVGPDSPQSNHLPPISHVYGPSSNQLPSVLSPYSWHPPPNERSYVHELRQPAYAGR
jgi:C6 transcription factor Pro1